MADFVKKPCNKCPFRTDVKPFLHPDRAYEIAISAYSPYDDFHCHKTIEHDENGDGYSTDKSKLCAGWLTMKAGETDRGVPKGFEPSWENIYENPHDMADTYREQWDKERKR